MKKATVIASLVILAFAAAPLGAFAQGAAYREYREELMAKGWKPNVNYGLKTAKGQSLYKYPEVVCGPELCFAKWRDKGGDERTLSLIRGRDGADHQISQ
ncbi:MAG: hypothetical protein N2444_08830 [Methylocystis sp.]|nr:hypothetical protein [Methylocystis sp.]